MKGKQSINARITRRTSWLILLIGIAFKTQAQNDFLDYTFNTTGYNLLQLVDYPYVITIDMVVQPDQKSVVAGYAYTAIGIDLLIARYNTDGTLDSSFGVDGIVVYDNEGKAEKIKTLTIDSNGNLLACGNLYASEADVQPTDWFVVRFTTDGAVDTAYGTDGVALVPAVDQENRLMEQAAIQSNDQLLLAGSGGTLLFSHGVVVRLTTSGQIDLSWGTEGFLYPYPFTDNHYYYGIGVQDNGLIVAFGYIYLDATQNYEYLIVRMDQTGALDAGFGTGGVVTADNGDTLGFLMKVDFQEDEKMVFVGTYSDPDVSLGYITGVLRFNADGSLDNSFNSDGIDLLDVHPFTYDDLPYEVEIMQDGKIVVVFSGQYFPPANGSEMQIKRYLTDGTPDPDFGENGLLQLNLTGNNNARAARLQSDDKLILAGLGVNSQGGFQTMIVARILSVGVPSPVNESDWKAFLNVYPNPMKGTGTLELRLDQSTYLQASLINSEGKTICTLAGKQWFSAGQHQIDLPLQSGTPSGNYFVRVSDLNNHDAVIPVLVD